MRDFAPGPGPPEHGFFLAEDIRAWDSARALFRRLSAGDPIQPGAKTIRLKPDERQYSDTGMEYARYRPHGVASTGDAVLAGGPLYGAAGIVAAGVTAADIPDPVTRQRIEATAAAQWGEVIPARVVLTDRRLVYQLYGRWSSFALNAIVDVLPNPVMRLVVLTFETMEPMRLRGPWAPWVGVALCKLVFDAPWPPGFPVPSPWAVQRSRRSRRSRERAAVERPPGRAIEGPTERPADLPVDKPVSAPADISDEKTVDQQGGTT